MPRFNPFNAVLNNPALVLLGTFSGTKADFDCSEK
jgi:hypothetical protein